MRGQEVTPGRQSHGHGSSLCLRLCKGSRRVSAEPPGPAGAGRGWKQQESCSPLYVTPELLRSGAPGSVSSHLWEQRVQSLSIRYLCPSRQGRAVQLVVFLQTGANTQVFSHAFLLSICLSLSCLFLGASGPLNK